MLAPQGYIYADGLPSPIPPPAIVITFLAIIIRQLPPAAEMTNTAIDRLPPRTPPAFPR